MKKLLVVSLLTFLFVQPSLVSAAETTRGKIYIEIESYGRAWYVAPQNGTRYYLKGGNEIVREIGKLALGITDADIAKIPSAVGERGSTVLVNRLKGYFLLRVENRGEIWYVHPVTGIRYALRTPGEAQALLGKVGLPVKDSFLKTVNMNTGQLMFDPTFHSPTSARLENGSLTGGTYAETIRPLASLTKLMTALVVVDHGLDMEQVVTLTSEEIGYPQSVVGDDTTSEIDLEVGDQVKLHDLWVAMLVASSNQSAVAMADATGLSHAAFIQAMNEKAKALGLTETYFYDIAGLDSHNVSTAREMAMLATAAFANPMIGDTTQTLNHTFFVNNAGVARSVSVIDRNYSLRAYGVEAAKTGYLVEAQRNVALKKDGKVIVVLNAQSMSQRNSIITSLLQ